MKKVKLLTYKQTADIADLPNFSFSFDSGVGGQMEEKSEEELKDIIKNLQEGTNESDEQDKDETNKEEESDKREEEEDGGNPDDGIDEPEPPVDDGTDETEIPTPPPAS